MPAPLQSIDPRARLVGAAALSCCVAVAQGLPACLLGLALGCALLVAARPGAGQLARRALAVNVFVLFLWLITPWTTPGAIVWQAGPLAISREGLRLCLLVSLKANAICAIFTALVAGTDIADLGHALCRLGCPRRLVWIMILMGRYLHVIHSEWRSLMTAARLRCFEPRSSLHTWRTLATLIGLLLVRCHDRARRVHEAMLLRAFSGAFIPLRRFTWNLRDTIFALTLLA